MGTEAVQMAAGAAVGDLGGLKAVQRRPTLIRKKYDLTKWVDVKKILRKIRALPINSVEDLEYSIRVTGHLKAALSDANSTLYYKKDQNTADKKRARAYNNFVERVEARSKPILNEIEQRQSKSPFAANLDGSYDRWKLTTNAAIRLFRPANIDLETAVEANCTEYTAILGGITVSFREQTLPLPAMRRFLLDPDRATREAAFRARTEALFSKYPAIADIFGRLVALRTKIANNADFDTHTPFAFLEKRRFDYAPEDCATFHESVEAVFVPLLRKINQKRAAIMRAMDPQFDTLRPWDTLVDPLGRDPLLSYKTQIELVSGAARVLNAIDPRLARLVHFMERRGHLDLVTRIDKAPGGYMLPFLVNCGVRIFMNADRTFGSSHTLHHEMGHSYAQHCLAAQPYHYRDPSKVFEIAEFASQALELMATCHLDKMYPNSAADVQRARREVFERIVRLMVSAAQVDAFQHWVYAHPEASNDNRRDEWIDLSERFSGGEDWGDMEDQRITTMASITHIFHSPFYYIEYPIAYFGALQVFNSYRQDHRGTFQRYTNAVALGTSRPVPEVYNTAGASFDFSEGRMRTAAAGIEALLAECPCEIRQLQ